MKPALRTRTLAVVGIVGCSLFASASVAVARRADSEAGAALIERARTAAVTQPFTGSVEVAWKDGDTMRVQRVAVSGDGTRMYANGVVLGADRFQAGDTEVPAVGSKQTMTTMPSPVAKYRLTAAPGPPVVGRPTTTVEAAADGVVRERWTIDDGTGVLVGREAYNQQGELTRRVALVELAWTAPTAPPTMPAAASTMGETEISSVQRPYAAPESVGAGYRIVGRYRMDDGTIHVLYSDGLRDLSVFQSRGDLDWDALPEGGRTADVEGVATRQYLAASGWTWVWERNGVVFTVVTDTTADEMPAVVADLQPAAPSTWDRFRSWVRSWF